MTTYTVNDTPAADLDAAFEEVERLEAAGVADIVIMETENGDTVVFWTNQE